MRWGRNVRINREIAEKAVSLGIRYFETAPEYTYGINESLVRGALKYIRRDRYEIASKLHVHLFHSYREYEECIDKTLINLNVEYLDYYILHRLNHTLYQNAKENDVLHFLEQMKKKGKVRYVGFSFHDSYSVFKRILLDYCWDMAQIRINYIDANSEASLKGVELALMNNVPIFVMQPLKAGFLVNLPQPMSGILEKRGINYAQEKLAFKWLYNTPNIKKIITGVTSVEQIIKDHIYFSEIQKEKYTENEKDAIAEIRAVYKKCSIISCTNCRYCLRNCPQQIPISDILYNYNLSLINQDKEKFYEWYGKLGVSCISCKRCEKVCPQNLKITDWIQRVKVESNTDY